MAVKAPGSVRFEPEEVELIRQAQITLLTGWTDQEYQSQPPAVIDAVWQIHLANKRIEAWATRPKKAKRGRR